MPEFRAPKGMADIVPPQSSRWATLVATFAAHASRAGFGLVLTPILENVEVFQRVGESTDIVRKEMYDFDDKGGRRLAVRPEFTAAIMRAFVEHRPPTPWKVWMVGPNLRYEQPQSGRFRQHYQVDAEIVGTDDPSSDVEVIALLDGFYRALGLRDFTLDLNSLGDAECRPVHQEALRAHFASHAGALSEQSRQTLVTNPLRVLDSKRPEDQPIIESAPRMIDFLTAASADHFDRVRAGLALLGIEYTLNPRLVRGLDYYGRTTFEFASHALDSAQNAIGGGGRYDALIEQLGGPAGASGIGFGSGIERILLACDAEGVFAAATATVDVFVVDVCGGDAALMLSHDLRAAGISADRSFDARSMKSQMKSADRSGARVALIVGDQERDDGTVILRPMQGGEQRVVHRSRIIDEVRSSL